MVSQESVQKVVDRVLKDYKFLVVSNREPYIHVHTPKGVKCKTPAAGLTAALDPLMQACGGTWVAGGSGDADRENVDKYDRVKVPPGNPKYILKRVWMSKDEVDKFYFGFANQTLWPLCHDVFQRPSFDVSFWEGYWHSNWLYAKAVMEEMRGERKAFIWFQDYHLALAPRMVRKIAKKKQKIVSAHFWHIPWPAWDTFVRCPWSGEILEGLLTNELIGFHLETHCMNFLASAEKALGAKVDYRKMSAEYKGHTTFVRSFPISIDFKDRDKASRKKKVEREIESIRSPTYIPYKYIGLGVDRIDYTKGIIERFKAVDRFLEKYPEYQKNFVFIEAAAPSRDRVPAYRKLNEDIQELVDKVNWKYQTGYWKPIWYIVEKLDLNRLLALQRTADFCVVSSLHDGMNLVAKEYVAANVDEEGVLILSEFAGATEELKEAITINPYDIEGFADAIKIALEMPADEKKRRMRELRRIVRENNIYKWLRDFAVEVGEIIQ
jgi:trehalose 6-phosphate synthase